MRSSRATIAIVFRMAFASQRSVERVQRAMQLLTATHVARARKTCQAGRSVRTGSLGNKSG